MSWRGGLRALPAAARPRPLSRLAVEAIAMGGRPAMRITLRETEDAWADIGLLRSIADVVHAYPGDDLVLLTVVDRQGRRCRLAWRAAVSKPMRMAVALLLAAQAQRVR